MKTLEEQFNDRQLKKTQLAAVMKELDVTVEDIRDIISSTTPKLTGIDFNYFEKLCAHDIVIGDFVTGIEYKNNDKTYYMMASAKSFYANPSQIAIGSSDDENIYMLCEFLNNSNQLISLLSFSKNKSGFGSSKYYKKQVYLQNLFSDMSDNDKKCLQSGLEASEVFSTLISKAKIKRKKL